MALTVAPPLPSVAPPAIPPPVAPPRPVTDEDALLSADGRRLLVRPMRRSDGPALAAAVAALSPQSRYQRFLTPTPALTRRDVAALTDLDHHAREALIARDAATGEWVAVGRYAAFPDDPLTADVAITVADRWQRRGVGTALVGLLVERARAEDIARLHATTLAANRAALGLLRRHGFRTTARELDTVELSLDLRDGGP